MLHLFGLSPWIVGLILAVLSPVLVSLGLFIGSAMLHLCLMLVGGAKRSFETTLRVVCFTGGSANLFSMIPVCGWVIALVYTVVLECIGLSASPRDDDRQGVAGGLAAVVSLLLRIGRIDRGPLRFARARLRSILTSITDGAW